MTREEIQDGTMSGRASGTFASERAWSDIRPRGNASHIGTFDAGTTATIRALSSSNPKSHERP